MTGAKEKILMAARQTFSHLKLPKKGLARISFEVIGFSYPAYIAIYQGGVCAHLKIVTLFSREKK